jgi:hypothetical protein
MTAHESIVLDATVVASKEQASADLGDEAAILNLKDGVYYGLDPVGARIWKLIQTPQTVRALRDTLLAEYDVDADRCERDLIALLQQLAQCQLIDIVDNV